MIKKILLLLFILCLITNLQASTYLQQMFASGYIDANGDPLSGGLVYVYSPGTTDYKETWSDYQATLTNTQPIVLDSSGKAHIYMNGVTKFVVYDSEGNNPETWDYVDNNFTTQGSLTLSDGSVVTVSFSATTDSFVNSGQLGVGITSPAYTIDMSEGSAAIALRDSTASKNVRIQNTASKLKIIDFTGSDVLLWEADIDLDDAPTGFYNTPVGTIQMYAGTAAPDGWLLCQGQTLDSTANPKYAALYSVIGILYGGSGASSFNLPDFQAKYPRGKDGSLGLGDACADTTARPTSAFTYTVGTQSASHGHTFSATSGTQSANHTHSYTNTTNIGGASGSPGGGGFTPGQSATTGVNSVSHTHSVSGTTANQSASHNHTVSNTGGGDSETRPNSVVVNYIIYTGVL